MLNDWELGYWFQEKDFLRAKTLVWNSVFARKNFCLEMVIGNWDRFISFCA
jgi:hypothetical protein